MRPTKYKKVYCEKIVEHMATGATATSFAAQVGVCRETIGNWAKEHEEFFIALQAGKAACSAWWEETARMNAIDGKGHGGITTFALRNLNPDDFSDVKEIKHKIERDETEINAKLREFGIDPDSL